MSRKIRTLLLSATETLAPCSESARLDAELLLCHILDKPRSYLFSRPEQELTGAQAHAFTQLLQRRQQGEPMAYLTGEREFWSLMLKVNTATLIPRPETEQLVEQTLLHIPMHQAWQVADLGTGSGAIALAIAHERPDCVITAVDQSAAALQVARDNADRLGMKNIIFLQGDWLQGLPPDFDIIVANPPYIRADDPHLQQSGLPYEPRTALVAENNGMAAIEHICQQTQQHLKTGGWLLMEHGYDQGAGVRACLQHYGYHDIETFKDLSGNDRVTQAQIK
jgi:release factor glutamine methyltransferase